MNGWARRETTPVKSAGWGPSDAFTTALWAIQFVSPPAALYRVWARRPDLVSPRRVATFAATIWLASGLLLVGPFTAVLCVCSIWWLLFAVATTAQLPNVDPATVLTAITAAIMLAAVAARIDEVRRLRYPAPIPATVDVLPDDVLAAAAAQLTHTPRPDDGSWLIGIDVATAEPVAVPMAHTGDQAHHLLLVGETGSGKTSLLLSLIGHHTATTTDAAPTADSEVSS